MEPGEVEWSLEPGEGEWSLEPGQGEWLRDILHIALWWILDPLLSTMEYGLLFLMFPQNSPLRNSP